MRTYFSWSGRCRKTRRTLPFIQSMSPIVPVSSWDCIYSTLYPSGSITSSLWSKLDQSDGVIEGGVTAGEKQRPRRRWIYILTRLFVQWLPYVIEVQAPELSTNSISKHDIMNDSEMKIPPLRTQNLPVWCSYKRYQPVIRERDCWYLERERCFDHFTPPPSAFTL